MPTITMPDELAQIIALHKEMFGGYHMQADGDSGSGAPTEGDTGPAFEPITSQEQLNAVLGDRLARERAKYADYDDLKSKAAKFAQLEDANKSEAQRQADKLAELEQELNGYKTREQVAGWAKEVADSTGVPVEALRGSTREELEAHAAQLKPILGAASRGVVRNAGKSVTTPETSDKQKLVRELFG